MGPFHNSKVMGFDDTWDGSYVTSLTGCHLGHSYWGWDANCSAIGQVDQGHPPIVGYDGTQGWSWHALLTAAFELPSLMELLKLWERYLQC